MAPSKVLREYMHESLVSGEFKTQLVTGSVAEVTLVSHTSDPVELMASTARGYTGIYEHQIHPEEIPGYILDIRNTKLATPTEMVHFTWLIKGVSRAWTHQAVRYRVGTAFIQQSMRFLGYQGTYRVRCDVKDPEALIEYGFLVDSSICTYVGMKDVGVADQDARGVLPTNILTNLFWDMSLSTLIHIVNTRFCCQAQTDEWLPILAQMRKIIRDKWPLMDTLISPPIERGVPCGFNASFDRPCTWKNRDVDEIISEATE